MKNFFINLILIIFYSIGIILSFPPYNLGFLVWFTYIPLFYILQKRRGYLSIIFLSQIIINSIVFSWLNEISPKLNILLAVSYALQHTLTLLICKYLLPRKGHILIPTILTISEYLRTLGPYGFPFLIIGYALHLYPWQIQLASLGGVWIISFIIYNFNYFLYLILKTKNKRYLINILIILLLIIFSNFLYQPKIIGTVKIALIQPNTNMFLNDWAKKEDFFLNEYYILSQKAKEQNPDLIIWPETAVGISLRKSRNTAKKIRNIINKLKVDLLLGNVDEQLLSLLYKEKYNSAFYIDKTGKVLGEHKKIKLIPFIEIVNYQLPLPLNLREKIKTGIYLKGNKTSTITLPKYKAAVVICFEAVFGDFIQNLTSQRPNIIYNLSSDGWSKSLAEHQLNYLVNVFRAVENKLYIVRVSDTGYSGIISPRGKILSSLQPFQRGILVEEIPLLKSSTCYSRFGDIFIKILVIIWLLYPLWSKAISKTTRGEK